MRRREFIAALGGAAVTWPLAARAQQPKVAHIGFLGTASATGYAQEVEGFRSGLRDLGYTEGKNIDIEFRWAEGQYDRLGALAAELVAMNVDVLVTHGTPGTSAAKAATTIIPVVMAVSGDADKTGLIQSLARPGGNVTGLTYFAAEQTAKRLELIKEAIPSISRVAFLINPNNQLARFEVETIESAARLLKVSVAPFEIKMPFHFAELLSTISKSGFEGIEIEQDGVFTAQAAAIADAALEYRIPAFGEAPFAQSGGLLGFGPSLTAMFKRAAYFVDRLLKGAKASELPVERPTKFEFVINLKTANLLNIELSPTLLVRADEVIE